MALTRKQIDNITADAVNLFKSLIDQVDVGTAATWVAHAMDAIVINETDELDAAGQPQGMAMDLPGGGTLLVETAPDQQPPDIPPPDALYAWMGPEATARWGNFPPDQWPGLRSWATTELAAGPPPGQDMRLVAVDRGGSDHAAEAWVRANVPEHGRMVSTRDAGVTADGRTAFLVIYQLAFMPGASQG